MMLPPDQAGEQHSQSPMDAQIGAVNLENPSVAHLRGTEAIGSENLIKIKLLVDFWRKI
jgi:hypothetical protein